MRLVPRLVLFTPLLLGPTSPVLAEKPSTPSRDLQAEVRRLEKEIEAVRGLKFKKPVTIRILPRPRDADPKVQGYYSQKDKAIILYNDIQGNYRRGVLIHELVHALQDQHFKLPRLHLASFADDAELAQAALIEGDATFTMIEVLKKEQPRVTAMLTAPLEKAHNLQNAFLYSQGARYVQALKKRGGWKAVNDAYRFLPDSTAAILHPEGITTISLGPGKSRGEFGIIRLLVANPATAPLAVQAAAGWRADRLTEDGLRKTWEVVFGTKDQARRFQEAMVRLTSAEHPDFTKLETRPEAALWRGPKGIMLAVLDRGDRVLVLEAPDKAALRELRERLEGPPRLVIYSRKEKRFLTFGELTDRLLDGDLVCIGETHDSEPVHRVQYEIIKALFARDERLGVGMEMFQRPFQPALDRYLRGETGEAEFPKQTEYRQRWGFAWSLYRPIVEFCRRNGLPLAALNAPRELTRRISKVGYGGLTGAEKKQLRPIDFHVPSHRNYWYERLAKMHGRKNATPEQKERSYEVMTTWDGYMAASAARFQQERGLRRLVILAGSGHIDRGFGIPDRAARRTGGKTATVHIEVGTDPAKATAWPAADFIIIVK